VYLNLLIESNITYLHRIHLHLASQNSLQTSKVEFYFYVYILNEKFIDALTVNDTNTTKRYIMLKLVQVM